MNISGSRLADRFFGSRTATAAIAIACLLQACASSTGPSRDRAPTAQIEIEEDVGFTITEDVRADTDVRLGYAEAVTLLEQGDLDRGISVLEDLVATDPGLSAPLIDLGIAKHRAGDMEGAEQYLKQALEYSPDHPIVHNELGIIYRESGRFAESRASYERALSVFPGYHYARRNLAVLCDLYLGDLPCALANYEAYMETVPEDEEVAIWISDLRTRLTPREAL